MSSRIECGSLGYFRKDGIEYRGPVQLGSRLHGFLILRKHPRAGSTDNHPDYAVEYEPHGGKPHAKGSAWIKSGERAGDFLSITLDDPDWSSPVNLAAFHRDGVAGNDSWTLVWSRSRGVRAQDEPSAETSKE